MAEPSTYYTSAEPVLQPQTQNLQKSRVPDRPPEGTAQSFREGPGREGPRFETPRFETPRFDASRYRQPLYPPAYARPNIPARAGSFGTVAAIAILALIAVFMFMKLSG